MEHVAVALNPRQGLIAGTRLYDVLVDAPDQEPGLALLEERLSQARWAVYEVRRALLPSSRDPEKAGISARQLRAVATGTRSAVHHALTAIALGHRRTIDVSDPGHPRVWLQRRGDHLPATEMFYALAPHVVADKERPGFATAWAKATTSPGSTVVLRINAELQARLDEVCQLTGVKLDEAGAEALEDWIRATMSDPDVLTEALARLDQQERLLQRRRTALHATEH